MVNEVAADMRLAHTKLATIEIMLINLIVLSSVLLLALIGGLLINGLLMSVVTTVGVVFALATAVVRHFQSQESRRQQKASEASEKSKIRALPEATQKPGDLAQKRRALTQGLRDLTATMSVVKSVDQRFNTISTLILDLGQAMIVVTFLILLTGADATEMPMLIILVLIFRFFISNLQTVTHTLIKLGPHYPFLVELWHAVRDVETLEPKTAEAMPRSEAGAAISGSEMQRSC